MKTSFSSTVVVLFVMLAALPVAGLAGNGGSVYSLLGVGDLRYAWDARSAGMGFAGIGLASVNSVNSLSPAAWARISRTRADVGLLYEGFNSTDGTTSRYLARLDFNGATLALPISQSHGIVFAMGLAPYSRVNYDIYSSGYAQTDTMGYSIHHVGEGGLSRAQAGLSYAPTADLSFGASVNYLFGSWNSSSTMIPTSATFAGGTTTENVSARGVTVTLSGLYTGFGDIVGALQQLSIGAVVTTRASLHTTYQNYYQFAAEADTAQGTTGSIAIPLSYGVGLAYQAGDRYVFAADYVAQPWSSMEIDGTVPIDIRNSWRIGFGVERIPAGEASAGWLDRIAYRTGFFYNATYYDVNGRPINEWGVTAGLGLPISTDNRLNVSLAYGSRGTTQNGLIKDTITRLIISMNISELWFMRYEEE